MNRRHQQSFLIKSLDMNFYHLDTKSPLISSYTRTIMKVKQQQQNSFTWTIERAFVQLILSDWMNSSVNVTYKVSLQGIYYTDRLLFSPLRKYKLKR